MGYFPFFVNIEKKTALIVGGGEIAREKAQKLALFGVQLHIVAPQILPELENLAHTEARAFRPEDLEDAPAFVVAATDDPAVNQQVWELCRDRKIPVNVVDDPEKCDFFFPALVKKGSLTVAIGTDGASPAAAKFYRRQIEQLLPQQTEDLLDYLRVTRQTVRRTVPDAALRGKLLRSITAAGLQKGAPLTAQEEAAIREPLERSEIPVGKVFLVGAGCGGADLITVRAMRLLQSCDAVVYDREITGELLEWIPSDALRIPVGKRASQSDILDELIRQARLGRRVVRLRSGDRDPLCESSEECFSLQAAGIPCEEVPGSGMPMSL